MACLTVVSFVSGQIVFVNQVGELRRQLVDANKFGDLDLVQTSSEGSPLRLLRNDSPGGGGPVNNYIMIRPRMPGTNHWAIGAIVTANVNGKSMTRVITAGTSTDSQEPTEAHFGLGDWPGGIQTVYMGLPVNPVHSISLK